MALTNAAGDQFALTFPEGAVLTDTTIRAIPIATSAGLPDGAGPISGLILQPDGLELARAATLEIIPKIAVPPESRLHWGFYGRGKDAFLHIPVQDTDAIVIPIDHFSGAGVGFADRVDLQLDRWRQSRIEDRVTTRIAEDLRKDKLDLPDRDPNASFREIIAARAVAEEGRAAIVLHPAASCTDIKDAIRTIMQVVMHLEETRHENVGIAGVGKHMVHCPRGQPARQGLCAGDDEGRAASPPFQLQLGRSRRGLQHHFQRHDGAAAGTYRRLKVGVTRNKLSRKTVC